MSLSNFLLLVLFSLLLTMALPFVAATIEDDGGGGSGGGHHHHPPHHPLLYFSTVVLYLSTMTTLLVDIALYLPMLVLFGEPSLRLHYATLYGVTALWQIMQALYLLAVSHRRCRGRCRLLRRWRQRLLRAAAAEEEEENEEEHL